MVAESIIEHVRGEKTDRKKKVTEQMKALLKLEKKKHAALPRNVEHDHALGPTS